MHSHEVGSATMDDGLEHLSFKFDDDEASSTSTCLVKKVLQNLRGVVGASKKYQWTPINVFLYGIDSFCTC